jgi:phosphonate transport system substrate-binding protein
MHKIRFAHDGNLEFPYQAGRWQELFRRFQVEVVPYEDMGKLTQDLARHQFTCAYLPAANQYYLRKDPFYHGIATALTANKQSETFKAVLIVKKESPIQNWEHLQGKRIGFIHQYCTSSYFGLALFLLKRGVSFSGFFSELVPTGAWQKQIDAVVQGRVDATMVMKEVWLMEPKNQESTRILETMEGLPAPIVTMSCEADVSWSGPFLEELLKVPKNTHPPGALFWGFAPCQPDIMTSFFTHAERALRE